MKGSAILLGVAAMSFVVSSCSGPNSTDRTLTTSGGAPSGGASNTAGEAAGTAGSGAIAFDEPITWCEALQVIEAKCQRCHTEPPENGAPFALLTYEDTQAPYFGSHLPNVMKRAVKNGFMPMPMNLEPPVEPLTELEKAILLTWIEEGATDLGGTSCD